MAKGFIVNDDLTTTDTYIAKVGNSFAHARTIKEAVSDAEAKHLINSPVEDRVKMFLDAFKAVKVIAAKDLFEWHHKLTGSCRFGRDEFVRQKGIDLENDSFTIKQFVELTQHSYGGGVIKMLIT